LQGDIDGDGRSDLVDIRYVPKARASCGFLLVVKTQSRTLGLRIPEAYKSPDVAIHDWWQTEPYLAAIVQLEAHRHQVVVARSHGAANRDVSLYGVVDNKLKRLRFHPARYEDELSLFGTVGTGVTNVRCRSGGPLIVVGKWPNSATGERWSLGRDEYELRRGVLVRTRSRTTTGSQRQTDARARSWGLFHLPFTGCTIARGRRL
jgi:hypothetical protein